MRTIAPIDEFLNWFQGISKNHQMVLARIFWISTTSSANDMVLSDEEYIAKFENYLTNPDFPLRILMKLIVITAIFDFIFENYSKFCDIISKSNLTPMRNIIFLEEKQWEKIRTSWWEFRNNILSQDIFSMWMEQISRSYK